MGEIPNYYRNTGESGVPVTGRCCPPPGKKACNSDPNGQGQCWAARSDMSPMLGERSPSPGKISGSGPQEYIGTSRHDRIYNGMTVYGRQFPDGSMVWDGFHCQREGGQTTVGTKAGGGRGQKKTYPSYGYK